MVKTFKLRPEAYQRDLWSRALLVLGIGISFIFAVLFIAFFGARISAKEALETETWTAILSTFGSTFLSIAGGFALVLVFLAVQFRKNKPLYDSVEIEIGPDSLARRQKNIPEIRLQRSEITDLEDTGNALSVHSTEKFRGVAIPKLLDGYEEVKATLLGWGKPIRSTQNRTRTINWLVGIVTVLGMLVVIFAFDPLLQAVSTIGMMTLMAYCYWHIGRFEGYDPKFRQHYLVLICVIGLLGMCKFLALLTFFFLPAPR